MEGKQITGVIQRQAGKLSKGESTEKTNTQWQWFVDVTEKNSHFTQMTPEVEKPQRSGSKAVQMITVETADMLWIRECHGC